MKRTLSLLITLLLSFAVLYAGEVTKSHNLQGTPCGLSVSSAFNVNLHNGPLSVQTTASEEIAEYVMVKMKQSGVVSIGLDYDRMPQNLKSGSHNWMLSAEVSIPSLEVLDISGAVKINTYDPFEVKDMISEISGASGITGLSLIGHEAEFSISGSSKDASGASHIEVNVLKQIEVELSGASHLTYSAPAGVSEYQKSIGNGCSIRKK